MKVICERAKRCAKNGETCTGMIPHEPMFMSKNKSCTSKHLCHSYGMVECVPVEGEEKRDEGK